MEDYKKAFEMLVKVTKEIPYCNNCFANNLSEDDEEWRCDDCHRKMMGWKLDPKKIESIKEQCNIK